MRSRSENLIIAVLAIIACAAYAQSYLKAHPEVAAASQSVSQQMAGQVAPQDPALRLSQLEAAESAAPGSPGLGESATLEELVHQFIRNHEGLEQSLHAQDEVHYGEFQLERDALVLRIFGLGSQPGGVEELERIADAAPESAQEALTDLNEALDRLAEARVSVSENPAKISTKAAASRGVGT